MDEEYRVFWTTDVVDDTPYQGGLYFRSEMIDFVKKVEAKGDKRIVGIKLDDSYNLEFIYETIRVDTNVIDVDFGFEEE